MAVAKFRVEVDVQITILRVRGFVLQYLCLLYDLNHHLLVNLDAIVPLPFVANVALSNYHKLHHMDEKKMSKPFSNLKMKVDCRRGI